MVITSTGKTDLKKNKIRFQERILKLPLEFNWPTPTRLHNFIYAFLNIFP